MANKKLGRKGPLYKEVKAALVKYINDNGLSAGDKILSERQIAEMFGVSQVTANKAVAELSGDGKLEYRRGIGTFIKGGVENQNYINIIHHSSHVAMTNPVLGLICEGIIREAEKNNIKTRVIFDGDEPDGRSFGRIVLGPRKKEFYSQLKDTGEKTVVVYDESDKYPYILPDNEESVYEATVHMINSGYSQLIFFWKNESTDENMHKRRKGFLRAVEDHWRGDKDNCRECDILESEKLYNYINSLSGERKLGVFCVADHVALQLLASIDKSLIPECVGVMAYDNIILGGAISPSLSTIDPHAKDVGQRAVDLLLAQVEEDADVPVKGTTIKADLILRDSVLS